MIEREDLEAELARLEADLARIDVVFASDVNTGWYWDGVRWRYVEAGVAVDD